MCTHANLSGKSCKHLVWRTLFTMRSLCGRCSVWAFKFQRTTGESYSVSASMPVCVCVCVCARTRTPLFLKGCTPSSPRVKHN